MSDFPNACIVLDEENHIIGVNPAAETLLGQKCNDMIGRQLADVLSSRSVFLSPDVFPQDQGNETYTSRGDRPLGLLGELKVSSVQDQEGAPVGQVLVLRTLRFSKHQEALRKQNEMLMALQETTFDLHSSLDLKVVLHNILERACKLLGTPHGYLAILRETNEMEPVSGFGLLAPILKTKITLGEGLAGSVWKTGKPLFVPNYDKWPGRLNIFPPGEIRAIISVPLVLNGQVVGVIGIARGKGSKNSFSKDETNVLMRFADLAVLALQNARLFEKAQAEIQYRRQTEINLRNANQVLQLQIERIELLQSQLEELAVRDALTNLFNRRYLVETLEAEFARAKRAGNSLAILMMDCDQLKEINDTYGHKAGDDFLVKTASVIRESIRGGDIACRYGGDEFVVVLENVGVETAIERAENLRRKIETEPILHKNKKIKISISIGIAMFPANGTFAEMLLQKADRALYVAKGTGKNRVVVFSDNM